MRFLKNARLEIISKGRMGLRVQRERVRRTKLTLGRVSPFPPSSNVAYLILTSG